LTVVVEKRVGRKRVLVIPKKITDIVGLSEGQKVRIYVENNKVIIEPVRDAIWLAIHGRKIGKLMPEEVEEESMREQEKLSKQ